MGRHPVGMPVAPFHAIAGGDTPLTVLSGVGPALRDKLAARGLATLQDLWLHLPRDYEDRTTLVPIRLLQPGVAAQVEGRVSAVERGFRQRPMLRVTLTDAGGGTLVLRFFHFRAQQVAQFAIGTRVRAFGTPRPGQYGLEIVHPSYRILGEGGHALGQVLDPVYPAIDGIGPATVRKLVLQALQRLPDEAALEMLPQAWLRELGLPSLRTAILTLHAPPRDADLGVLQSGLHPAQRRLALEELLAHQLSLRRQRLALQAEGARPLRGDETLVAKLKDTLPFALTRAQARVYAQLRDDLRQPRPMLRLVQGDVALGVLACRSVHSKGRRWRGRRNCCPRGQTRSRPSPLTLKVALPRPTIRSSSS